MDAAQWTHEQIGGLARVPMEADHHQTVIPSTNHNNNATSAGVAANTSDLRGTAAAAMLEQKRTRPSKDQNINCPRCNSTNTKFCYYNNYSLTQPRYLCKTCRRYWTQGGSLRNVPVGGGSRKNKRSSSSSTSTSTSTTSNSSIANKVHVPDLNPPNFSTASFSSLLSGDQNYSKIHHHHQLHGQDLNLSFPTTAHDFQAMFHHQALEFPSKIELGVSHHQQQQNNNISNDQNNNSNNNNNCGTASCSSSSTITSTSPLSALELLRTGMASRGGLNPYVPVPMPAGAADSTMVNTLYPSSAAVAGGGFQLVQDFKPNLSFFGGDHHQGLLRGSGARFGGTTSSSSIHEDHHQQENGGAAAARLLFPFADMNKMSSTSTTMDHHHQSIKGGHEDDHDQGRGGGGGGGSSTATATTPHHGYWNGMLGGGGTW